MISHTSPGRVAGSSALRCKRCGEIIPEGKLSCEPCLLAISHESFMAHQRRYADLITKDQIELTLVYIPSGNGNLTPLWHLQRFGDIRHAYCNLALPAGNRQDHLRFSELYQRDKFCVECAKALVKVLDGVPIDRAENPSVRS